MTRNQAFLNAVGDGLLIMYAVLTISPEGIDAVDVVVGETYARFEERALQRMQEVVEYIISAEWGQSFPEGGVRHDFVVDQETEFWHWGHLQRDGFEVRMLSVDEFLVAR